MIADLEMVAVLKNGRRFERAGLQSRRKSNLLNVALATEGLLPRRMDFSALSLAHTKS